MFCLFYCTEVQWGPGGDINIVTKNYNSVGMDTKYYIYNAIQCYNTIVHSFMM